MLLVIFLFLLFFYPFPRFLLLLFTSCFFSIYVFHLNNVVIVCVLDYTLKEGGSERQRKIIKQDRVEGKGDIVENFEKIDREREFEGEKERDGRKKEDIMREMKG